MDILVRKGESNDLEQVLVLIKELAVYENAADEVKINIETLKSSFENERPHFDFLIAQENDQIIGLALYYERFSTWKGPYLYLEDLIVSKAHRRKGVGEVLFKKLLKLCQEGAYKKLCWQVLDWNELAINFYKKFKTEFDGEWIDCTLGADQIKKLNHDRI